MTVPMASSRMMIGFENHKGSHCRIACGKGVVASSADGSNLRCFSPTADVFICLIRKAEPIL